MNNAMFIKTTDEKTKDILTSSGFQLVDANLTNHVCVYTFMNSSTLKFDESVKDKITYSSMLTI